MFTILFYLVSLPVSYFLFRVFYKIQGEDAKYNPHRLGVIIMLMPLMNIIFPVVMIAMEFLIGVLPKLDYKKFYKLK